MEKDSLCVQNSEFEDIRMMLKKKRRSKTQIDRDYIIEKLWQVFKDGYVPSRGKESYDYELSNKSGNIYNFTNCLSHACFNLTNKMFDAYNINPPKFHDCSYFGLMMHPGDTDGKIAQRILYFIRETGLKVEDCDPNIPVRDFNSWKMALYTANDDYHLLLEEPARRTARFFRSHRRIWTSKAGYWGDFCKELEGELPTVMRSGRYYLYNTYKITNENADEDNPFVR